MNDAINEYRDGREFLRGHPELVEELVEHFRVLSEKSAEPMGQSEVAFAGCNQRMGGRKIHSCLPGIARIAEWPGGG